MKLALIDLDNTMADYDTAITRDLKTIETPGEVYAIDSSERVPHIKERVRLIRKQTGWWLNLAPIPAGFAMVALLEQLGYMLHVLSRAPKSAPNAYAEKVAWVDEYLPGVEATISPMKHLVRGAVLFDDWPEYIENWLEQNPEGLVIMPDRRWNKHVEHKQVIRYTGNVDEVRNWLLERMR